MTHNIGEQTVRDSESLKAALDKLPPQQRDEPTGIPTMERDTAIPATMQGMNQIYNINIMKGKKGGYVIVVDGGVAAKSTFKEVIDFIAIDASVALEEATPPAFPPKVPTQAYDQDGRPTTQQQYPPQASPAGYGGGDSSEPPRVLQQRYEPPRPPSPTDQVIQTIREAPIAFLAVFLTCVGAVVGFMGGVKLF